MRYGELWWAWTKWYTVLQERISRNMFWLKLRQCKGSILPQFLSSCCSIWQVDKIIAEDVNRAWEFRNSALIIFYYLSRAVLYAATGEFSSNACRKLMMHTIKNPQHGIRAQMVLKLTNKLQMAEMNLTAAFTSSSERVSLNYDPRIRSQTTKFKQTFNII